MGNLHLMSVHSLCGTPSIEPLRIAQNLIEQGNNPTYLLDLNLTNGISLAESKPLLAPKWPESPDSKRDFQKGPISGEFHTRAETLQQMQKGHGSVAGFINDFFLYATPDWSETSEANIQSFLWPMEQSHSNFKVIPASPYPEDIDRILPVINAEEQAAFLESRMEYLIDLLVQGDQPAVNVVLLAPAGFVGLSLSAISLVMRLMSNPKRQLAKDGGMPHHLENATITGHPIIVLSDDPAEIRQVSRWLNRISPKALSQFRRIGSEILGIQAFSM